MNETDKRAYTTANIKFTFSLRVCVKFKTKTRNNWDHIVIWSKFQLESLATKTIRLFALAFHEVTADEAEGRINYHLIEIASS